jgi:hypothetical protein
MSKEEREARLAAQLRANLKRRKTQARGEDPSPSLGSPEEGQASASELG